MRKLLNNNCRLVNLVCKVPVYRAGSLLRSRYLWRSYYDTGTNNKTDTNNGCKGGYRAGGLGSIPGRTNTQGLKIIEEVLPLQKHLQMVRISRLLG